MDEKETCVKPLKLEAVYKAGVGWQIEAFITKPVHCAEFTMKGNHNQAVLQLHDNVLESCIRSFVGYEPWIQFEPKEWRDMIGKVFKEMAEAWNEKHAAKQGD